MGLYLLDTGFGFFQFMLKLGGVFSAGVNRELYFIASLHTAFPSVLLKDFALFGCEPEKDQQA